MKLFAVLCFLACATSNLAVPIPMRVAQLQQIKDFECKPDQTFWQCLAVLNNILTGGGTPAGQNAPATSDHGPGFTTTGDSGFHDDGNFHGLGGLTNDLGGVLDHSELDIDDGFHGELEEDHDHEDASGSGSSEDSEMPEWDRPDDPVMAGPEHSQPDATTQPPRPQQMADTTRPPRPQQRTNRPDTTHRHHHKKPTVSATKPPRHQRPPHATPPPRKPKPTGGPQPRGKHGKGKRRG